MKYERGSFITVPSKNILSGLHPIAQCLYMWLCAYANESGNCFPSRATLAENVGCGITTIDNMMVLLIEKGLVCKENRTKDNEKQTNLYTVQVLGGTPPDVVPTPPDGVPLPHHVVIELNPLLTQSTEVGETDVSQEFEIVKDDDKPTRPAKFDPQPVYAIFHQVLGVETLPWLKDKTQRLSAENLTKRYKLAKIKSALEYAKENEDMEFIPQILSPWDLDHKWDKLAKFKLKHG